MSPDTLIKGGMRFSLQTKAGSLVHSRSAAERQGLCSLTNSFPTPA
jgi:hypothetical protein